MNTTRTLSSSEYLSRCIAIVGQGCVLPSADTPDELWEMLVRKKTAFTDVPGDRWDGETFFSKDPGEPDKSISRLGAFIHNADISWNELGLYPKQTMVPRMELIGLEAGLRALRDTQTDLPEERTAVIVGNDGWVADQVSQQQLAIRSFPIMESINSGFMKSPKQGQILLKVAKTFQKMMANKDGGLSWRTNGSFLGARLCARRGFKGLNICVDGGEASSFSALFVGMQGLRSRLFDAVLLGAVSRGVGLYDSVAWSQARMLSREIPRPLDKDSSGMLLGEGSVFFVLKRLPDALADGDNIHAVMTGIGIEGCGNAKGFTTPHPETFSRVMRAALDDACRNPDDIAYVEVNGTGVPDHDSVEIDALKATYNHRPKGMEVYAGSMKANIGHLGACSGAAGILKGILTFRHHTIPPQAGFQTPHPMLFSENGTAVRVPHGSPVQLNGSSPCCMALNGFGFGGLHGHVIMESKASVMERGASGVIVPGDTHKPFISMPSRTESLGAEPIAIVGMGGVYPGAPNIPVLAANIHASYDAICEVPAGRWPKKQKNMIKICRGGFVLEEPDLDPRGIPPYIFPRMDRTHRWALAAAEEAFADCGYENGLWADRRVAVLMGDMPAQRHILADAEMRLAFRTFQKNLFADLVTLGIDESQLLAMSEEICREHFTQSGPIDGTTLLREKGIMIPALVARRFQLPGPTFNIEAACSSGFVSLYEAVRGLRSSDYDVVALGSSWSGMTPENFFALNFLGLLSKDRIRPFDHRADGYLMGEGAGVLILKRYNDALKDGDRIYALIRGVGAAAEGTTKLAFVPNWQGQTLAIERALKDAGEGTDRIDFIECTGAGISIGDNAELKALNNIYGTSENRVSIGSVKSMTGNLHGAANSLALTHTVLSLYHRTLPSTLGYEMPSASLKETRFHVQVDTEPWPAPKNNLPRMAAVHAYAMSGTSLHVILEEVPHEKS